MATIVMATATTCAMATAMRWRATKRAMVRVARAARAVTTATKRAMAMAARAIVMETKRAIATDKVQDKSSKSDGNGNKKVNKDIGKIDDNSDKKGKGRKRFGNNNLGGGQ